MRGETTSGQGRDPEAKTSRHAAAQVDAAALALLVAVRDLVLVTDGDLRLTFVGPGADDLFCPTPNVGENLLALIHPDDAAAVIEACGRAERVMVVCRVVGGAGGTRTVEMTTVAQTGLPGTVCALRDVTGAREITDRLTHDASHDSLTSLANRTNLLSRLDDALGTHGSPPGHEPQLAVLYVDLDGFKRVNDTLGHAAGDTLLVTVADRLGEVVRPGDTVARLGGDEFVIVADRVGRPAHAMEIAQRVRAAVSRPMPVGGRMMSITASIGVALGAEQRASDLLNQADVALYRAKQTGRDRAELYDPGMVVPRPSREQTERMLRRALDDDGLVVVYQPVVDLADGRRTGAEALLRLRGDDGELVAASAFIDVAEETGMILPIGAGLIDQACFEAVGWDLPDAGFGVPRLSINLSARQLADRRTAVQVARTLERAGLAPSLLCVEVPETVLAELAGVCGPTLRSLRGAGVLVALDDFGCGRSSIAELRGAPLDLLKLNRSVVAGLDGPDADPELALAVIRLGQALGLTTVANGVETAGQAAILRDLGCDRAQGFWFGHPVIAAELTLPRPTLSR